MPIDPDDDATRPAAPAGEAMKECPFCGRADRLTIRRWMEPPSRHKHAVSCLGCKAYGPVREDDPAAIEAWDARPPHSDAARLDLVERRGLAVSRHEGRWQALEPDPGDPGGYCMPAQRFDDPRAAIDAAAEKLGGDEHAGA